jgi:hypothetical protein
VDVLAGSLFVAASEEEDVPAGEDDDLLLESLESVELEAGASGDFLSVRPPSDPVFG